MKQKNTSLANNKNICLEIFRFSNVQDLLSISQASMKYNKIAMNLDIYYKEECINFLVYDHFMNYKTKSKLLLSSDENDNISSLEKDESWKSALTLLAKAKNSWDLTSLNNNKIYFKI